MNSSSRMCRERPPCPPSHVLSRLAPPSCASLQRGREFASDPLPGPRAATWRLQSDPRAHPVSPSCPSARSGCPSAAGSGSASVPKSAARAEEARSACRGVVRGNVRAHIRKGGHGERAGARSAVFSDLPTRRARGSRAADAAGALPALDEYPFASLAPRYWPL